MKAETMILEPSSSVDSIALINSNTTNNSYYTEEIHIFITNFNVQLFETEKKYASHSLVFRAQVF